MEVTYSKPMPTHKLVREWFDYDTETGHLLWKKSPAICVSVGQRAGCVQKKTGYRYIHLKGGNYRAHRLVWLFVNGCDPLGDLDHINGTRDDNRVENLRDAGRCANAQNIRKARSDNSSGLLGAHKHGRKFRAVIVANGKRHILGVYDTPEQAHKEYMSAKRRLHIGGDV